MVDLAAEIDPIISKARSLAEDSGTLEAYKTFAETMASMADVKKSQDEINNSQKLIRYEWIRSVSTGIVPLLTVLTLGVTVLMQFHIAEITDRANEDMQWKTVVEAMTRPSTDTSDVIVINSLAPFYHSNRYRDEAYGITFLLFKRLAEVDAFKTIYAEAFGSTSWNNIVDYAKVNRIVFAQFSQMDDMTDKVAKGEKVSFPSLSSSPGTPVDIDRIRYARNQLLDELKYLGDELGSVFRQSLPRGTEIVDLSDIFVWHGDLRDSNIQHVDVSGSIFDTVDLRGAVVSPDRFENSSWPGTQWWLAKSISPAFLLYLATSWYPYGHPNSTYTDASDSIVQVDRDVYRKNLGLLCANAHIKCLARY